MSFKNFFIIFANILFGKNIVLINSPLQFLNFVEFTNSEEEKLKIENKYIFLGYLSDRRINIINNINEKIYFCNYLIVPFKNNINIYFLHLLIKFRKYFLREFENVIFGDFNYYLFKEFYKISKNQLMLDDGNNSLFFNKRFDLSKKKLKIFTVFKKEIFPDVSTIENNFTFLKKFINKKKIVNKKINYFIGSPFVEAGILSRNQYLFLINKIKNYYKNIQFIYIPHQSEKKYNYLNYKFKKILVPTCGIELYLAKTNFYPSLIVGSHSVLFVLIKKIFNKNIKLNPYYFEVNHKVRAASYDLYELSEVRNYFKKNILNKIKKININVS
jgi:hypothetical protein